MSKSRLLASVALAALCLPVAALSPSLPLGSTAALAQTAQVSFQLFFDELQPHGVWVRHARYQYVFCPTGVDASWRPYTEGRWLYLEGHGWYFASDEPHAWATYHYGRWFADQQLGWCWVPGTKWAPAWVSWRSSDDVIGWAPLPPENDGYAISVEISSRELPAGYWVYVPTRSFVEPELSVNIVLGTAQPQYFTQTRYLGPVIIEGDVVVNNVIEVNYIEQVIGQQVIVYQPETAPSPDEQSVTVDAQVIAVFDQDIAEPEAEATPPEPVEEAEAVEAITAGGGTAGATAEIVAEDEVEAEAEPASVDAETSVQVDTEAEAAPAETQEPDATIEGDETLDLEAEATPETVEPVTGDVEAEMPEDTTATPVDGAVDEDAAPVEEPEVTEQAPAEATVPADQTAPADATAPAEAEAETAVDAEVEAEEALPAEGGMPEELKCLPEEMVNGRCPPVPVQQ